jgi:hypothetical protein
MKDKMQAQLASLTQTRDTLVKLRTALKNKVNNILSAHGINLKREALSSEKKLQEILAMRLDAMVEIELEVIIEEIRSLNQRIGARAMLRPLRSDEALEYIDCRLRAKGGTAVATLTRVVLQCYYRDDRVVRSLGLEARPPYPKGHVLEDGDWSLLDPVRARPPMWRRA